MAPTRNREKCKVRSGVQRPLPGTTGPKNNRTAVDPGQEQLAPTPGFEPTGATLSGRRCRRGVTCGVRRSFGGPGFHGARSSFAATPDQGMAAPGWSARFTILAMVEACPGREVPDRIRHLFPRPRWICRAWPVGRRMAGRGCDTEKPTDMASIPLREK